MQIGRSYARRKPVEYDALRRRLWILGQRCHHGATGSVVAGAAVVIGPRRGPRSQLALFLTGSVLMVHDWKDRSIWFERGHGSQA